MFDEPKQILVFELLERLRRSWWTAVAGFSLGAAGAVIALGYMTPVFEATASLDLSSEKLPAEYFEDTVTGDEDPAVQLELLRRNVLSDGYLSTIIENIREGSPSEESEASLIDRIRANVRVLPPRWGTKFQIRYVDTSPTRAAAVANGLADLYVKENLRFRSAGAEQTLNALEELAEGKRDELRKKQAEIADLQAKNPQITPESQRAILDRIAEDEKRLEGVRTSRDSLRDRLDVLEVQRSQGSMYSLPSGPGAGSIGGPSRGDDAKLGRLRDELAELESRYTGTHPDVVRKKAEIDAYLEERTTGSSVGEPKTEAVERPGANDDDEFLDVEAMAMRAEIERLNREEQTLIRRISESRRTIVAFPAAERELSQLETELQALSRQYEKLQGDVEAARTAAVVEKSGRGRQFEILSPAVVPAAPIFPRPTVVLATGAGLGAALFVGPVLLLALFFPVVGSEARLSNVTSVPVLSCIPSIATPAAARERRRRLLGNITLSVASGAVLLIVLVMRTSGAL